MFCSEGIFGAVLLAANEISLLKRSLIPGRVGSLTWLIGPRSRPGGFCANKEVLFFFFPPVWPTQESGQLTLQSVPSELQISCGQERASNRRHLFPTCKTLLQLCDCQESPAFQPHPQPQHVHGHSPGLVEGWASGRWGRLSLGSVTSPGHSSPALLKLSESSGHTCSRASWSCLCVNGARESTERATRGHAAHS